MRASSKRLQGSTVQALWHVDRDSSFTQSGAGAIRCIHRNAAPFGQWLKFASAQTLDRPWSVWEAADIEMAEHRPAMRRWAKAAAHITPQPNRKHLLRIHYDKL
jgi:hypothetical protein